MSIFAHSFSHACLTVYFADMTVSAVVGQSLWVMHAVAEHHPQRMGGSLVRPPRRAGELSSCPSSQSSGPDLPSLAPTALTEISGVLWPLCSAVTSKEVRFFYDLAFLSAEALGSSWCLAEYLA